MICVDQIFDLGNQHWKISVNWKEWKFGKSLRNIRSRCKTKQSGILLYWSWGLVTHYLWHFVPSSYVRTVASISFSIKNYLFNLCHSFKRFNVADCLNIIVIVSFNDDCTRYKYTNNKNITQKHYKISKLSLCSSVTAD